MAPDFWARPERFEVLSSIALMDRVRAAAGRPRLCARGSPRPRRRSGKSSKELIGRLALQLHLTGEGIRTCSRRRPSRRRSPSKRRSMAVPKAAMRWTGARSCWTCTGAGRLRGTCRFRTFRAARGSAHPAGERVWGASGAFPRDRPACAGAAPRRQECAPDHGPRPGRARTGRRAGAGEAARCPGRGFAASAASNILVRRYRDGVTPSVRDMKAGWRSGRLDAVLRGDFDLIGAIPG